MLNDFLQLNANIIAVFGFSVVGGVTMLGKAFLKSYKQNKMNDETKHKAITNDIEMLKESNRAILHGQLFDLCIMYLSRGYIKPVELRNLNYLYKSYRNLNGNGTIEMLFNDVSEIPIKED